MPETDVIWYGITGGLFAVFAVLDGPETGISVWYLFSPPAGRRTIIYSLHDNQLGAMLWLVAGLGAVWFGFPGVRNFVGRSIGPVLLTVLAAYVIRIAAVYLRERFWNEYFWDWAYAISGILPPLVFGAIVGCLLEGLPLSPDGRYAGTIPQIFNHFTIAVGVTAVFMYATAASLNCILRTSGPVRKQALSWAGYSWLVLLILYIDITIWSIGIAQHISLNFLIMPILLLVPLACLASIILVPVMMRKGNYRASCRASLTITVMLILTFGICLYPFLVPVFMNPGTSLTIRNSAAGPETLIMLITAALVGIPLLVVATILLNRRGKRVLVLTEEEIFDSHVEE